MTRDELADELLEIRRYVRTDVDHVRERLMGGLVDGELKMGLFNDLTNVGGSLASRLYVNLSCGLHYIQVDPEVLEGYLYAAAFELRCGRKDQSS